MCPLGVSRGCVKWVGLGVCPLGGSTGVSRGVST